jgi:hypothetical protein
MYAVYLLVRVAPYLYGVPSCIFEVCIRNGERIRCGVECAAWRVCIAWLGGVVVGVGIRNKQIAALWQYKRWIRGKLRGPVSTCGLRLLVLVTWAICVLIQMV